MADIDWQAMAESMTGGKRQSEKVIYYRLKSGWIGWGDTQASKQLGMIQKGAIPLPQYGTITNSEDIWGPILRHRDGPAEFPVEQVLTYRWYKPENVPVQNVRFPQLAGQKIVEFPCPECSRPAFHSPIHLGSHLRVMHAYDRSEVLKYGEAMHIDFSKIPGGKEVVEYAMPTEIVPEVPQTVEEAFEFASVSAETPATAEVAADLETINPFLSCPDCDYTTEGKTKHDFALQGHRRAKHLEAVPA